MKAVRSSSGMVTLLQVLLCLSELKRICSYQQPFCAKQPFLNFIYLEESASYIQESFHQAGDVRVAINTLMVVRVEYDSEVQRQALKDETQATS